MCWSAMTALLLIRSSDYLHGTAQGPVKIYAQNYLQARLSEVNRQ